LGNYIKARPTIYKGIRMRSRLEASYAQYLDSHGVPWEYEPMAFASELGQYLPDFAKWPDDPNRRMFVEVKPSALVVDEVLERMHIILASEPEVGLQISHRAEYGPWRLVSCYAGMGCGKCERPTGLETVLPRRSTFSHLRSGGASPHDSLTVSQQDLLANMRRIEIPHNSTIKAARGGLRNHEVTFRNGDFLPAWKAYQLEAPF
jgi:hypothetical protein